MQFNASILNLYVNLGCVMDVQIETQFKSIERNYNSAYSFPTDIGGS